MMETALKVLLVLAMIPVILFMVKVFVLGPIVYAQISADGTRGTLNQIKAAFHYLRNVEALKTIYIRDGKFTHKPVCLVRNLHDEPTHDNTQP